MRVNKSKIALILWALLVTGALTGCDTSSPSSKNAAETTKPVEQKKYDIRVFSTRIQPNPDSEIMKKVQEKLGQNLILTAVPDVNYVEKMNLYYASNELPDVFSVYWNEEILQNATAKFTEEDFKTYMPQSYAIALKQYQDYGETKESIFNRFTVGGKLAGVFIGQTATSYPYGLVIRKDLLDEFGLQTPQTLSDWEAFLNVYKQKYPNKYPISARGRDLFTQSFYPVLAAYGVTYNNWQLKDNKLVYPPFMPEMRDALTTLNKWYKAGYINPEWITMDSNALTNEWVKGNTVYYQFVALSNRIQQPFDPGSIFEQQFAKNPQAKLEWIPFPKSRDSIKPALVTNEGVLYSPVAFGKHLEKDPDKLHAAMRVVDRILNDKDLVMLMSYGIQGKTYDLVDGLPVVKKEFNNNDARTKEGFGWSVPGGGNWDIQKSLSQPYFLDNLKKYAEEASGLYSKANNDWDYSRVNGPLISPSGENLDTKGKSKFEEYNRMFAEVVIGTKTLADFDKFIEQYKKDVGNEMMEAANRLYLQQWLK